MNYFIFLAVSSLAVFFFPKYSHGTPKFPFPNRMSRICVISKNSEVFQPNSNGQWPANILKRDYKVSRDNGRIRLDISWTAEMKNVKGFRLVLSSSQKSWCRLFDYTNFITNPVTGLYSFDYTFKSIYKQKVYKAELSPLPFPLPSFGNLSVWNDFKSLDCSGYDTTISYDYDGRNMNVTFTKGLSLCNYKAYEVTLYHNKTEIETKIVPTRENVDKLQTYFELNICRGYYFILVTVYDENFSDSQTCVCKGLSGLCQRCSYKKSEEKYFVPDKSCTPKTAPSVEQEKDILFPLTIVMGLLLLTALALTITHWKLSAHLMVKKQGIVLFLDDHEHHTNAVMKLVNYLNESHLKVLLASTSVKNRDLVDISDQLALFVEVLKSDFVLLVLSSALQKRMAAWDKNQDYVDFFKEKNSNILSKTVLETLQRSNKLYVCKFDHVAEFGNWPKPCYSLPSNLTNMAADLNGQSYSQRLVLCNCLKSKALWDEFQTAFKKTCTYEQSHANWFQEKYLCPRNVAVYHFLTDEMSQDSLKLKELFIDNKNNYPDPTEERITVPSVFSEAISDKLEAVNNRNL